MRRHSTDGDLVSRGRKSSLDLDGGDAKALPRARGLELVSQVILELELYMTCAGTLVIISLEETYSSWD